MNEPEQAKPLSSRAASERVASGEQRKGGEFPAPLGPLRGGRLVFTSGASRLMADLRGLELRSFVMSGGASNVTLHRPEGVAAQIRVGGGSTNLAFDEQRLGTVGGEVSLRSPDHEGSPDRYDITTTGGASGLTIDAG